MEINEKEKMLIFHWKSVYLARQDRPKTTQDHGKNTH